MQSPQRCATIKTKKWLSKLQQLVSSYWVKEDSVQQTGKCGLLPTFLKPAYLRRGVVLVSKPGMCEMSMPDDDQHTLKLQRVRSTDIGQLVVTARNQFGSDLCTLQLAMAGQSRQAHHVTNLAF